MTANLGVSWSDELVVGQSLAGKNLSLTILAIRTAEPTYSNLSPSKIVCTSKNCKFNPVILLPCVRNEFL